MEWMHCNLCFSQPNANDGSGKQRLLYLTSCGHIFCVNCGCFADGTSDCCKLCKSKCSSIFIGEKAFEKNPDVLQYFQDPSEICEKLCKVMKFQKSHHVQSVAHHNRMLSKYNRAKLYIKKLEHELKITKNELLNKSKDSYCNSETQSTVSKPIFHRNSTPFKIIEAKSKDQNIPSINKNMPNLKYREQSFRNESSVSSSGSMRRSVSETGSSVYASPLQDNSDEKCVAKLNNLQLNSFEHIWHLFKRNQ